MRKLLSILVCLAFLATCAFTVLTTRKQNRSGSYSVINGVITEQVSDFLVENFQGADTPEKLAEMLTDFSQKNFTYDEKTIDFIQNVNLERFIYEQNFTGVCLDFATFVKATFCTIAKENNWENVSCYCAFVSRLLDRKSGHVMNYITVKNDSGDTTVYEFDTTWDLNRYENGKKLQGISVGFTVKNGGDVPKEIEAFVRREFSYNLVSIC